MQTKKLHNVTGTTFLQAVDYEYNERGWLKKSKSNAFTQRLLYNDAPEPLKQYNGNIASQLWGIDGNYTTDISFPNAYSYSYDALNRLKKGMSTGIVMSEELDYDVMGNITSLNRDGAGAKTYIYKNAGNQLESVADVTRTNYIYDANGNATTDGRNKITLTYNYLNLPITVNRTATAATGSFPALPAFSLSYTYNAAGQKLKKISGSTTTDYVGGIQYTNGNIDFIQTEEGVARWSGSAYIFDYNLTYHLGNVRYTFDQTGARLQADDYYPFGKTYNSFVNGVKNHYLYNGKELQEGLKQYDYGARFYDPVIGRWNVVDPLAEKMRRHSPYNYGFNNPIRFVDLDGMMPSGPGDPPDWVIKARDAIFSLLGYKPEHNEEQAVPEGRTEMDEKIIELGTKVENLKTVGKALKPASKLLAEKTGDALETSGNVVTMTGYVAAPVTEGASLTLVPIGSGIGFIGTGIKFGIDVIDGNYKDAAFTAGTEALFGKFGSVIEGAHGACKIVKTDAAILGFFNEAWKNVAGFVYDTSKEKKKK